MARTLVSTTILATVIGIAAAPPAGAVIPDGFSAVVVLATNSVSISSDVVVASGDVVANDASPGPTLNNNYELYVDRKVTISGSLQGDSIRILNQSSVGGDVSYNDLDNSGSIAGSLITPLALPVFGVLPLFHTGPSDGPDVTVPDGGSQTLAPGTYGDIVVGAAATLHLTGGVYNVRSIDLVSDDGQLTFGAASEV
ncbi:MAG TPA: hypothetical protein VM599_01425, partial [Thermoanaerobaculia bacterium]|nr:hypothetical protein [Thermoanaerobaculia bacterium]